MLGQGETDLFVTGWTLVLTIRIEAAFETLIFALAQIIQRHELGGIETRLFLDGRRDRLLGFRRFLREFDGVDNRLAVLRFIERTATVPPFNSFDLRPSGRALPSASRNLASLATVAE